MKSLPSAVLFQPAAINPVLVAQTQTCVPAGRKEGQMGASRFGPTSPLHFLPSLPCH